MKTSELVVVLPPINKGLAGTDAVARWLARGRVARNDGAQELVTRVCNALGRRAPSDGLAALRYCGHYGAPPAGWIAGADPVHFAAHLTTLSVHPLPPPSVDARELDALFETLQAALGEDYGIEFSSCDGFGYLSSTEPFDTESLSPTAAAGMLDGRQPASALLTRLRGEVEMLLHDHVVNREREARGEPPINGLWTWGGSTMPDIEPQALPLLVGDDPLLSGYWKASGADARRWPGRLANCLDSEHVVVVCPEGSGAPDALSQLGELQSLMSGGRVDVARIVFREGQVVDLKHSDRLRFWRRDPLSFLVEARHG
jgi:hypothetical protein